MPRPVIASGDQSFETEGLTVLRSTPELHAPEGMAGFEPATSFIVRPATIRGQNPFTEHTSHNPSGAVCAAGPERFLSPETKSPFSVTPKGLSESTLVASDYLVEKPPRRSIGNGSFIFKGGEG